MIALGDVLDGTARRQSLAGRRDEPDLHLRPTLILVFMLAAVSLGAPATAATALQAALAATYVTTLGQFLTIDRRLVRRYEKGARKIDFLAWFRVAFPIFLIEGFGFLLTNSDVIVVGFYLPPDQVAVYFAAAKTMALVQFVFFAVKAGATPRFSALMAEGDRTGLATFAGTAARWTFWPSLAVGALVLLLGEFTARHVRPRFHRRLHADGHPLCRQHGESLGGPCRNAADHGRRQKLCVGVYFWRRHNIGLNVSLIPHLGLAGAAIATASAMAVEAVLLHWTVRRALGVVVFALPIRSP